MFREDGQLAKLNHSRTILALGIGAFECNLIVMIAVVAVGFEVRHCIETCLDRPVIVYFCRRLETEEKLVICLFAARVFVHKLTGRTLVGVLEFSLPLHHVGIALEVRHAHAEVVQLVGELGGEAVNECAVGGG